MTDTPIRDDADAPDRAQRAAPRWAHVLLWVVPALWATNYLIARAATGVIAPNALALGRWSLAALLLLPLTARGLWRKRAALRREALQLLVLGALGMWICGAWLYLGGHHTSATNMALIYAGAPIGIAIASARLLRERMRARQWAGGVLALAGLLVVIAQGDVARLAAVRFGSGDVWVVAATLSWIAYSVLLAHWPSSLGPAERLVAMSVAGVAVLLPFTLAEAWLVPMPPPGWRAAGLVAAAAVLPGVLSYVAYLVLQRELGAARTALMLYLTPLYAALLAWALLGETLHWHHVVGAALILPSIALASRSGAAGS